MQFRAYSRHFADTDAGSLPQIQKKETFQG